MTRMTPKLLPAACLVMLTGVAHADISNFTFVGIEGVGDLEGELDDRLGITNNADEHIINVADCERYTGGEITVKVRIDPKPTGSWQYAVAYAAPGHTCSTTDANPEATDGCYVPAAQRELTTTTIEFDVNLDELIGSECDSGEDGDATLYVIVQNTSASEVKYETIIVDVDLELPAAPVLDEVASGDARFTVKWSDDTNNEDDLEYDVYYSDAPFTDADLDAVDAKKGLTAKNVAIEDGISNEVTYYVSVAARDAADNVSLISNQLEVIPASTTDFWEGYKGAGGNDPGCSGGLPGLGYALAALALARRARRAPSVKDLR